MIIQLESLKLKEKDKDSLLDAFPLKVYPKTVTRFHEFSYMAMYTITG
jgi:hypothetical protein